MAIQPEYNQQAVDKYFRLSQNGKLKERLIVVRDRRGLDHIECRRLTWQENILNRLGISRLALYFGYGDASLRSVLKKCPQCGACDPNLKTVVVRYNKKHLLRKITLNDFPWLGAYKAETLFSASADKSSGSLKALYNEHIDLNIVDQFGRTPLMIACQAESLECAQFLIEKGADVKRQDRYGKTLLMYSVKNEKLLQLILSTHPDTDINVADSMEKTALDYAIYNPSSALLLIQKGAIPSNPESFISRAVIDNRNDLLQALHEKVKNLTPTALNDRNLDKALFFNKRDAAQYLISLMKSEDIEHELSLVPRNFFIEVETLAATLLIAEIAKRKEMPFETLLDSMVLKLPKESILQLFKSVASVSLSR